MPCRLCSPTVSDSGLQTAYVDASRGHTSHFGFQPCWCVLFFCLIPYFRLAPTLQILAGFCPDEGLSIWGSAFRGLALCLMLEPRSSL